MNENVNTYDTNNYNEPLPQEVKEKKTFSAIESIFAWFSILCGYLFCRVSPISQSPLGGFCFIILLFVVTIIVLAIKKCRFKALPLCVAASAVVISLSLFLTANSFLHFFSYTYALASYCYFIYAIYGNQLETGFSNFILMDYLKAIVFTPFFSIGYLFMAMFSGKMKKSGKTIGKLSLGIGLAFIPTLLVFCLLSYDNAFMKLMERIFDWDFEDVFCHLGSFILGIPLGMYMFGLFVSSRDQRGKNVITKEQCSKAAVKIQIIPTITAFTAVIPVLLLYVIFFISQWDYYISGFTGKLPNDFSYAEYAREGFFQLCTVTVINFIIILCVILFMHRRENTKSVLLKILCLVISIFTLILISTALSKMFLYIEYYGLTHKRIYSTWFMVVLAIIFLLIMLNQFFTKIKTVIVGTCVIVISFGALALSNVDVRIAEYNVNQYKDGNLPTVDIWELYDLSYAGVPSLIDLAEYLDGKDTLSEDESKMKERIEERLDWEYKKMLKEKKGVFDKTLPYIKARRAMDEYLGK